MAPEAEARSARASRCRSDPRPPPPRDRPRHRRVPHHRRPPARAGPWTATTSGSRRSPTSSGTRASSTTRRTRTGATTSPRLEWMAKARGRTPGQVRPRRRDGDVRPLLGQQRRARALRLRGGFQGGPVHRGQRQLRGGPHRRGRRRDGAQRQLALQHDRGRTPGDGLPDDRELAEDDRRLPAVEQRRRHRRERPGLDAGHRARRGLLQLQPRPGGHRERRRRQRERPLHRDRVGQALPVERRRHAYDHVAGRLTAAEHRRGSGRCRAHPGLGREDRADERGSSR